MFFTDPAFFIFLPIVVLLYWVLPFRWQNWMLLFASYLFYGYAVPWTLFVITSVTLVNYFAAILIEEKPERKKISLVLCCVLSLSFLVWFKYAIFFLHNLQYFFPKFYADFHIFLPAGISFFTFQGLAYTADVYTGRIRAERNLLRFALFKAFFPQLVAGPIERAENLLRQVNAPRTFRWETFFSGIDLLCIGYVKKVVIADNVATYVNMIFDLKAPSTMTVFLGGIGFGIQILADFSAYTDIARGCSRLMGFELMENFRHPYLSKSPGEFWRRWHISLSNCIRDYIYIPLGGSRVTHSRWLLNIFVVWFICGLWHGAGWNFIVWGLYWGLMLILYRWVTVFPNTRIFDLLRIAVMYFWITIGWIFFRTRDLSLMRDYLSPTARSLVPVQLHVNGAVLSIFLLYASLMLLMLVLERPVHLLRERLNLSIFVRTIGCSLAALLITIFAAETGADFYYFQF